MLVRILRKEYFIRSRFCLLNFIPEFTSKSNSVYCFIREKFFFSKRKGLYTFYKSVKRVEIQTYTEVFERFLKYFNIQVFIRPFISIFTIFKLALSYLILALSFLQIFDIFSPFL